MLRDINRVGLIGRAIELVAEPTLVLVPARLQRDAATQRLAGPEDAIDPAVGGAGEAGARHPARAGACPERAEVDAEGIVGVALRGDVGGLLYVMPVTRHGLCGDVSHVVVR